MKLAFTEKCGNFECQHNCKVQSKKHNEVAKSLYTNMIESQSYLLASFCTNIKTRYYCNICHNNIQ